MTKYLTVQEAAEIRGVTCQRIRQMCSNGSLAGARRQGSQWRIPTTAHAELATAQISHPGCSSEALAKIPADKRQQALRRVKIIKQLEDFAARFMNSGGGRIEAIKAFSEQQGIKMRTLQRWIQSYHSEGLAGLVDRRGRGVGQATISPGAWETFKSMYLSQQRLSVKLCWQNIKYLNSRDKLGWQVPSLRRMQQLATEQIPRPVRVLHREGIEAYNAKCAPYIQADPDSVEPGQIWIGDHHQCNCWVRHRGRWVRPWLTAWQDMRSRAIVGWYVSAGPNQSTILLATKRGIERYGPPDSVKIDNGRDYDSEMWTGTTKVRRRAIKRGELDEEMLAGLYSLMGVNVSFAKLYHPQSKAIERFFDTLDIQFVVTMPTYLGKDTDRKPDYLNDYLGTDKALREAHSLDGFAEELAKYLDIYNRSAHSSLGGRSPADVLAGRKSRRVLADGVLELLMKVWSGERKVGKNGVKFRGLWYGQYNTDLIAHQGRSVRLAYDPDDIRSVDVYDSATLKLLTIAGQNQLIRYGDPVAEEYLRAAHREKARAVRFAKQARQSTIARRADLTRLTLDAMDNAAGSEPGGGAPSGCATLRPVVTPLNSEVVRHRRLSNRRKIKRAVGAEGMEHDIDLDLDSMGTDIGAGSPVPDLGLWDDEE